MDHKIKREFRTLLTITVGIGLAALALAPLKCAAQGQTTPYAYGPQQPNFYRTDTNDFPVTLTNTATTATFYTSNQFILTVRQDKGISLFETHAANSSTNQQTMTFTLDTTPDGTNWTTTGPITWSVTNNGTTSVTSWTNLPSTFISNVRKLKISSVTCPLGTTNSLVVSKFWFSYSGQ